MTPDGAIEDERRSLTRHALVGGIFVMTLIGGLIWWASSTQIAGAVVAAGTIIVETHSKSVQHREGGTVREILARNDDLVAAGDVLLRLDDTIAAASLAMIDDQMNDSLVQEARLLAEIDGRTIFDMPPSVPSDDPYIQKSLLTQQRLLASKVAGRDGRIAQLAEQITQIERQIEGLDIQGSALVAQIEILEDEQRELADLFKAKLVESSRVNATAKALVQAEGERGRLISAIAEARATIVERRLQMSQIGNDLESAALDQLQATRQKISELLQERHSAVQRLAETQVRAPQAGVVHQSTIHTIGGVVGAGEVLMQIVPQSDVLLMEVRIDPMDVDKLAVGQEVVVRLSSFDQRSTPEMRGALAAVSPDFIEDVSTGQQYYTARIRLVEGEFERLPADVALRPGMPIQAFVTTANRTVLSFLLHPLSEQLRLALRED